MNGEEEATRQLGEKGESQSWILRKVGHFGTESQKANLKIATNYLKVSLGGIGVRISV